MNKLQNIIEGLNQKVISQTRHFCPTCRRQVTEKVEIDFLKQTGECGSCDHLRGEALDEALSG